MEGKEKDSLPFTSQLISILYI